MRPGDRPTLYKHNGAGIGSANSGLSQTEGLNVCLVRMFKWTRNRIFQCDGSGCFAQRRSRQADLYCRCHAPTSHIIGADAVTD